jgi:hypothetical protein
VNYTCNYRRGPLPRYGYIGSDHIDYLNILPEENRLAEVSSNIWGTKFKILGLNPECLPLSLGQVRVHLFELFFTFTKKLLKAVRRKIFMMGTVILLHMYRHQCHYFLMFSLKHPTCPTPRIKTI